MDSKQFHGRVWVVIILLGAVLAGFAAVLYNLQVVNGASYLAQSTYKIANRETVEAARGEILDRYGRVLVSNRATYQVTLETDLMGAEAERNETLLALLRICREKGVDWADNLPISAAPPFAYTTDTPLSYTVTGEDGTQRTATTQLARLLTALKLDPLNDKESPTAAEVIAALRGYFLVDPDVPEAESRALVGVLYEMTLRKRDVVQTGYVFAQDVDIEFISTVKEHSLVGVRIDATTVRQYSTEFAAHLLGRVAPIFSEEWPTYRELGYSMDDTVGKDGVEMAFEQYLRGEPGERSLELSTTGKVVSEAWVIDPKTGQERVPDPGDNVFMTVDIKLQEALERALAEGIAALPSQEAEGGAAVVVDVKTGGVLAMTSYPTFDLSTLYSDSANYNAVVENPLKPLYNRSTMGLYSPGSIFKMVVGAAALQEGFTTTSERIRDTGAFSLPEEPKYPYGDYHPQCWIYRQYRGTHGQVNLSDALRDSCNIYFFTMGHRLGIDLIDQYAAMFGLGEKTGIELPEYAGQVAGPETSEAMEVPWYGGDLLSASIGQGNTLCTPLQMANYVATMVNGGNHYSAHLLSSVKSNDFSQTVYEREPELLDSLSLDQKNLEALKLGMWKVANEKTSSAYKYFVDCPVEVGAKTGTAQVGANTEANAVFVCFAPYDDPQIAISIVVEKGGSGTELSAIAADIINYYFTAEATLEAVDTENTLLR